MKKPAKKKKSSSGQITGRKLPPVGKGLIANLMPPWQPGTSGNPGGRPKNGPVREAYLKLLSQPVPGDAKGRTYAEALAERQLVAAINGNLQAAVEITDRVEGKSVARTELTGAGGDDLFPRLSREENDQRIAELLAIGSSQA